MFAAGEMQDIALEISDEAWASIERDPELEVMAILTWNGLPRGAVLRLKGSSSFRTLDQKPSFKIDVHQFVRDQRVDGCKRLTLNNMVQDPTMLREHAYAWLAAELDLSAPRHTYARVTVNGAPFGLYGLVETKDEQFVERYWPDDDDGNLYESSGADFTYERDWFDLEEQGGTVPGEQGIEALVDAVEDARNGDVMTMLEAQFDVPSLLTQRAIDSVSGNDDGYVFNHHNFHVYHAPIEGRWYLSPWGTDRAFTQEIPPWGDVADPMKGHLAIACWADDACADLLEARIRDVIALWEGAFRPFVDDAAKRIEAECEADPRRDSRCDPDEFYEFIEPRADYLGSLLD